MSHFNVQNKVGFIWSIADLLRGPYRPNQYKDLMLPLIVLRRIDRVKGRAMNQYVDMKIFDVLAAALWAGVKG